MERSLPPWREILAVTRRG